MFFASSNCHPTNKRLVVVKELMTVLSVHSYGGCEHNKDWVGPLTWSLTSQPGDHGPDGHRKLELQGT
jgi:hypothetical protein